MVEMDETHPGYGFARHNAATARCSTPRPCCGSAPVRIHRAHLRPGGGGAPISIWKFGRDDQSRLSFSVNGNPHFYVGELA